jgi:hypothetical protein
MLGQVALLGQGSLALGPFFCIDLTHRFLLEAFLTAASSNQADIRKTMLEEEEEEKKEFH